MKYYAIADLHGRYDLLDKAYEAIKDDTKTSNLSGEDFKIITLGDYIDRGPQSKEIIQSLMDFQSFEGAEMVCLQGNHEAMAVQSITSLPSIEWWGGNGGWQTLESYGFDLSKLTYGKYYDIKMPQGLIPDEHVKWMASLPIYYETTHQLFVHAGVPQSQMKLPPKNPRLKEEMLWMLYDKRDGRGWKDKHVVHGHHQFADGPHQWQGRTDLDCYAWRTGRLVIGVFDDTQGPARKFLEVLGDDYGDQRNVDV